MTSDEYRHVPTGTLARLAQRLGKVFASASTWYLAGTGPKVAPAQATHPSGQAEDRDSGFLPHNEIWHIDTTLIRLLDGSRAYLHAVLDNFSRRVLAWKVTGTFDPAATAEILLAASKGVDHGLPTVLTDGGVENFNGAVDELIHSGLLHRVLAGTEITYSNSMIESWWRVLKHQWLYLNTLDTVRLSRIWWRSMCRNTIRVYRTQRSVGKRRMRCTSRRATAYQRSSKPHGKRHAKPEQKRIGSKSVSPANCWLQA